MEVERFYPKYPPTVFYSVIRHSFLVSGLWSPSSVVWSRELHQDAVRVSVKNLPHRLIHALAAECRFDGAFR